MCLLFLHDIFNHNSNEESNMYLSLGYPIFSIDIHPNGKRFATGGQGISIIYLLYISPFSKNIH